MATVLDSDAAVAEFAAQFDDERMGERLSAEVADGRRTRRPDAGRGGRLDRPATRPRRSSWRQDLAGGVTVTAGKIPNDKQCLVPVTTVALVAVDAAAV